MLMTAHIGSYTVQVQISPYNIFARYADDCAYWFLRSTGADLSSQYLLRSVWARTHTCTKAGGWFVAMHLHSGCGTRIFGAQCTSWAVCSAAEAELDAAVKEDLGAVSEAPPGGAGSLRLCVQQLCDDTVCRLLDVIKDRDAITVRQIGQVCPCPVVILHSSWGELKIANSYLVVIWHWLFISLAIYHYMFFSCCYLLLLL